MHIPKTIINKLIPFFPKYPYKEILKKAKASIHKQQSQGCLEVANGQSWARVWTTKLSKEDELTELKQFLIERSNLEDIGYGNTLEEAAIGFDEVAFEKYFDEDLSPYDSELLKQVAFLAEKFPKFKDSCPSGGEQVKVTVDLLELKKIVDLAVATAEASQINAPSLTLSFSNNTAIYWQMNNQYLIESPTYLADGLLMPMKTNQQTPAQNFTNSNQ